ncbi:hypothetical protein PV325_008518 [Microctonus aethiopoides]|nr:hypothetical protein PV325_008518 [Microctonus aethiopoides]KAK0093550.1 hypothetical protein PV326_013282 [Microctonus aethiopoides]
MSSQHEIEREFVGEREPDETDHDDQRWRSSCWREKNPGILSLIATMNNRLQVPELRLPAGQNDGNNRILQSTQPLLLVPASNIPKRRHSWICGDKYRSDDISTV